MTLIHTLDEYIDQLSYAIIDYATATAFYWDSKQFCCEVNSLAVNIIYRVIPKKLLREKYEIMNVKDCSHFSVK